MSKKKKKKGLLHSRFYRIYFAVVGVALVAIGIGLIWLNGVVKDYEAAQPYHVAEQAVKLFEDGDYAALYALDSAARTMQDGDEAFYIENMTELTAGRQIGWREAFSTNADERRYQVTLDGERFATVTLVKSGETTAHGNALWKLGSVNTNVVVETPEPEVEVVMAAWQVTAPEGYSVTAAGRALTEADVASRTSLLPADFPPSGVSVPEMVTYRFEAPEGERPAVTVTDAAGASQAVSEDGENALICPWPESAELREKYGSAVIKMGEAIARFTSDDLGRGSLLEGFADGSPAEDVIKRFSSKWAPSHKKATVVDPVVTEFYALSEDCFTCHVSFNYVLTSKKGIDYEYPTAYTLCVIRRNGEDRVYNMLFH